MQVNIADAFTHYLIAKKSIDDRSINRHVYGVLARQLAKKSVKQALSLLEVGSGCGTMLARLLEWGLMRDAQYTAMDSWAKFIHQTDAYLSKWGLQWDYKMQFVGPNHRQLVRIGQQVELKLINTDLMSFLETTPNENYDVILAHAFLDLVNLDETLPGLVDLTVPGGYLYLTLNFDGMTIFEPPIDLELDNQIEELYHASMDNRRVKGHLSGNSCTGRRLIHALQGLDLPILAAGSSDWVMFPPENGYNAEEIFFLNYILDTIESSLSENPSLDPIAFREWIAKRRHQIMDGSLIYIAHQLDVLAQKPTN